MEGLFAEHLSSTLVGLTAAGVGVIFFLIEQRSSTTVVLSLSYVSMGFALMLNAPFADRYGPSMDVPWPARLLGVFEAFSIVCFALWLAKVAATAEATTSARRQVDFAVRLLMILAVAYVALGAALPHMRLNDFVFSVAEPGALARPGFWLFAAIYVAVGAAFLWAWVTLIFQRLDDAERVRAGATVAGTPFAVATASLPLGVAEASLNLALLIWLVGFFRYFVIQGERGAFMSRFLSPGVSHLVRMQGMAAVMQPKLADITAVCCDLRGFTAYAAANPSATVVELLNEYYQAVGAAVAQYHGTIKDYAGDGVLVLIGAPLPIEDHQTRGLELARRIAVAAGAVAQKWSTAEHRLGLGIGVASGPVTVGAIGSSSRMEYTAVGAAVNLSARLCQAAADGEILLDGVVAQAADAALLRPRGTMRFKGLADEVPVFEAMPA
jgi:adenylate cyclase